MTEQLLDLGGADSYGIGGILCCERSRLLQDGEFLEPLQFLRRVGDVVRVRIIHADRRPTTEFEMWSDIAKHACSRALQSGDLEARNAMSTFAASSAPALPSAIAPHLGFVERRYLSRSRGTVTSTAGRRRVPAVAQLRHD